MCNFLFTLPAFYLIDGFGRVALLLATYPGMIVFMLATTLTFACAGLGVPKVAVETLVFFFTAFYSVGQGPGGYPFPQFEDEDEFEANQDSCVYILGRGFPSGVSRKWYECCCSSKFVWRWYVHHVESTEIRSKLTRAGLLTMFVPRAQYVGESSYSPNKGHGTNAFNLTQAKMLGTFVALEVLANILIFCFVPETAHCTPQHKEDLNHLSLEEISNIFKQPALHHTNYRFQAALPYFLQYVRWALFHPFSKRYDRPRAPEYVYRWSPTDSREGSTCQDSTETGRLQEERTPEGEGRISDHNNARRGQDWERRHQASVAQRDPSLECNGHSAMQSRNSDDNIRSENTENCSTRGSERIEMNDLPPRR